MSAPAVRAADAGVVRFYPVFLLVALMWVLEVADLILPGDWDLLGIWPRDPDRLYGVALSPMLHGGFGHLMANTIPVLVLGCLVALGGRRRFCAVTAIVALGGGLLVWLAAPTGTVTIGASGLVFGYLAYLVVNGVRTRRLWDIVAGVVAFLLYGSGLGAMLPWAVPNGVSWQAHLAGALAGGVAAWVLPRGSRG